jgi:hypothetical protein
MISMKIENGNLQMRHFCLICLLLCNILPGAQNPESPLKMPGSKEQAFPLLTASQALPSEQQLAENTASLYPQSIQTENGLDEQNKNVLFEKPENGIALGTSVGNASLFLAFLIILYGIIFRIKDSNFPKNKKQ